MKLILEFADGDTPEQDPNTHEYYFVRSVSKYDDKERIFGAYYLKEYPLQYDSGECGKCPGMDHETCHAVNGDCCPTTGWFDEVMHPDYDTCYESLSGTVVGYCKQPDPVDRAATQEQSQ